MESHEAIPYRINPHNDGWEVLDDSARVVIRCRDGRSATEYAVLLSEAYQRGFKAGQRKAKEAGG